MTATAPPTTGANSDNDPATVGGSITRLNATDGLFLRAEHLNAMQDYARDLVLAAGLATGTGVVYGCTVTLSENELHISRGLAIDPLGRPLRSAESATVSLPKLDDAGTGGDDFWVLEIVPAQWLYGTEKAFGNLCDDPCDGSAIAPWQAEGFTVQLREDSITDPPDTDPPENPADRRSWLAAKYFERERTRGKPWLTPSTSGQSVSPITGQPGRPWSAGNPPPSGSAVPLAVVQRIGDDWVLDVWTARREMGDPSARRTWQWRLGMRPWDVFLAQVLQFQDQLAAVPTPLKQQEPVDPGRLLANLDELVQGLPGPPEQLGAVVEALKKAAPLVAGAVGPSLRAQGFLELPPAGFLRVTATGRKLSEMLGVLFGENVDLRVCHCRADYVPHAIEQAQHLDRIPLDSSDYRPRVDVLVPDKPADLPALQVKNYGWVAFVRRRDVECDEEREEPEKPPVDLVDVYLTEGTFGVGNSDPLTPEILDEISIELPAEGRKGPLSYPAGTWAYPGGDIVKELALTSKTMIAAVVALTHTEQRRPLAALRASLFAASFDTGLAPPPIYAIVNDAVSPEVIVVMKRPDPTPPEPPPNPDVSK